MSTDQPTPEQLTALIAFATKHGKDWKEKLKDGWRNSAFPGVLQQIRNQLGPEWLAAFEPEEVEIPAPKPEDHPRVAYLEVSREKIDFLTAKINLMQVEQDKLKLFHTAYNEWMDKMEWTRREPALKETRFLGMHLGHALRRYVYELKEKVEYLNQVVEQRNGQCVSLQKELEELVKANKRELRHPVVKEMLYAFSNDYKTVLEAIDNCALYRVSVSCTSSMTRVFEAIDVARNVTNITNDDLSYLNYVYLTHDGVWLNEAQILEAARKEGNQP